MTPGFPHSPRVAKGELVVHRAHKRAVLHAGDTYIKVFRPGQASGSGRQPQLATARPGRRRLQDAA